MNALKRLGRDLRGCASLFLLQPIPGSAQQSPSAPATGAPPTRAERDGQRDFDFHIGTWKTHVSRRLRPLTGSTTWVQYDGTTVVRKVWNGRANLVELEVDGPKGHLGLLSFRLYNAKSDPWSLNGTSSQAGVLSVPTIGDFKNGRAEFFAQETLNGRAILVRFVISDITPDSCHFEQAFSDDARNTPESTRIPPP